MTRVLHTADTHLGYRQYHSPERRRDFLDAFRAVIEDAIEDDVDAVVHAGDLFHDRRPGLIDILGALDALEPLADADIPFLAVVGNHEAKRDAQWLDLFERLSVATRLGDDPVTVGETAFYGLDFVPRGQREQLSYEFAPHDADHAVLVSHGLFEPLVPDYGNVEWDAEAVLNDATVGFDAMLLGDEHAATTAELDGTWVTYCGSTERTSASERDERGYNLVSFEGGDVRIGRRGIDTRPFVFVDLELAESEGPARVRERLSEHDLEGAVVQVTLTGDGESIPPARIESHATEAGALVARVTDRRDVSTGESLPEASFADPDDAVRERLRELGLSAGARDLDETIRSGTVADSNVADETERYVEELLEDADPASDPASASAPASDPDGDGDGDARPAADAADGEGASGDPTEPERSASDDGQASMGEYL
ncbi:DNA double-strand break repair protein Mre11 [Natronomonas sp.]|uniref:DNA double-strand break repair protein Mre11 n=1 Tax=Natronomonas sp. TaxID=2184060 RepID=UPI0026225084|nr:DNA double-strand break repair protein Mre11 [Natronomonas sp.]